MITIYEKGAVDFGNNGLGTLNPISCTVTETLNGNYEVVLTHPIDEAGKYARIQEERIIKVPVPAGRTPRISAGVGAGTLRIYKIVTDGRRLYLRAAPSSSANGIKTYKPGTEVVVIDNETNDKWSEVETPDGKHGWMWTGNLSYVRTEVTNDAADSIKESEILRELPFRIYMVEPTLTTVTAYARHIFYDLMDNMVSEYKPTKTTTGAAAFIGLAGATEDGHGFTFYSDLDSTAEEVEITDKNPAEAILGDGGLVENYGGELARDWWDVYLVKRVGEETGIQIREGKNLLGIKYSVDITNCATRIIPKGADKDGKPLYLPEKWIDNTAADKAAYINHKYSVLEVKDAKEKTKGDDKRTKEECYAMMRKAAEDAFREGADLPDVTLNVDFIDCAETEEYRQYRNLQGIHMGDTVRVVARRVGVEVSMRMTQYSYNCLTKRYEKMTLGTIDATIDGNMINPRSIGSGTIKGSMIKLGGIGSGQIEDGAVNGLKIALAAIEYAHIGTAAIDQLSANAITAIRADIRELVAGNITTDQLYADLAVIAAAQITAANIEKANIQWAEIENLSAEIAKVVNAEIAKAEIDWAQIKNAQIDAADIANLTAAVAVIVKAEIAIAEIDWARIKNVEIETAQIKLGAITQALIAAGAIGTAQIADGSITSAKIVELSADVIKSGTLSTDRLLIKGAGGLFYEINATAGGLTSAQLTEEQYKNAISGTALVARSVTADKIAAKSITANEILGQTITAAEINVANLFAADATIAALNNYILRTQTIEAIEGKLDVWASNKIRVAVTNAERGLQTQITANADAILIEAGRRAGGTQLLKNGGFYGGLSDWSKMEYNVNGEWRNLYVDPVSPNDYRANEVPNLVLHAQYETGMFGAAQVVNGLRKNTQYTISGYVASHRCNRAGIEIRDTTASRWAMNPVFDVGWGGTNLSAYNRFEYTFDTGDYSDYQITLYSSNFQDDAYVWWAQVKLEEGNMATAWSPHPDDPASGVDAGGVVRVDQTGVHMSGGTIEMETSDGDEYIHIRNDGISASSLSAPDVTPRYGGPGTLYVNPNATSEQIAKGDTFRSLADALAKLSGRWVGYNVTINLAAGMTEYGSLSLVGVSGGWWITIQGNSSNPAKLVGGLYAYHGSSPVSVKYLNVDATGDRGVHAEGGGQMVQVLNCKITGRGSGYGICSYRGACVEVENCEVYDFSWSLYGHNCGLLTGYNCKGNNQVSANHSTIYLRGTMPCDSPTWAYAASWAGQVIATSITVDQGSKPTPIPAPTTAVYDLLHAVSYAEGNVNSWVYPEGKPNDDIYQGYTGQAGRICGCMWFDNAAIRSALNGKTIRQASIRLTAQRYVGYGREVTVYLRGTATSYSGRSGPPALTTDYGMIGTAEPAVTGTFTIPAQAISDIASGRIEGLVLYHQDTADMQGKNYSRNYMRFDGSTSGNAETRPRLTVVYQ